jgi:hypothetical protein
MLSSALVVICSPTHVVSQLLFFVSYFLCLFIKVFMYFCYFYFINIFKVVVGSSWGSLPATLKQQWTQQNCSFLIKVL